MPGQEKLGSLDEVLVLEDGSLFGEATEGSNFGRGTASMCSPQTKGSITGVSIHGQCGRKTRIVRVPVVRLDTWDFYVETEFAAYEEVANIR